MQDGDDEIDAVITAARGDAPAPSDEAPLDDGLVLAWRAGRLSPEAAEALEARLARDPEARAVARALAEPSTLDAWAADQVGPGKTSGRWVLAFAATFMLAAGTGIWLLRQQLADQGPQYIAGPLVGSVKTQMGHAPETGIFLPTSQMAVAVRPVGARNAVPPITVYADRGGAELDRVVAATITEGEGGTARIEVSAGDAFATAFGGRTLYVVVGPWDDGAPETLPRARATRDPARTWIRLPVDYRARLEGQ